MTYWRSLLAVGITALAFAACSPYSAWHNPGGDTTLSGSSGLRICLDGKVERTSCDADTATCERYEPKYDDCGDGTCVLSPGKCERAED